MLKFEENLASRVSGALQPMLGVQVTVTASNGLPATLYADDESTVLANPATTDANGYFGFKAANGEYTLTFSGAQIETSTRKIELYDADDDPPLTLAQAAVPTASSRIGFQAAGVGALPRSVENKISETVSVKDFGAAGDGVADDYVAIQAAFDWAESAVVGNKCGVRIHFPRGEYRMSQRAICNIAPTGTISSTGMVSVHLTGDGDTASIIVASAANTSGCFRLTSDRNTECYRVAGMSFLSDLPEDAPANNGIALQIDSSVARGAPGFGDHPRWSVSVENVFIGGYGSTAGELARRGNWSKGIFVKNKWYPQFKNVRCLARYSMNYAARTACDYAIHLFSCYSPEFLSVYVHGNWDRGIWLEDDYNLESGFEDFRFDEIFVVGPNHGIGIVHEYANVGLDKLYEPGGVIVTAHINCQKHGITIKNHRQVQISNLYGYTPPQSRTQGEMLPSVVLLDGAADIGIAGQFLEVGFYNSDTNAAVGVRLENSCEAITIDAQWGHGGIGVLNNSTSPRKSIFVHSKLKTSRRDGRWGTLVELVDNAKSLTAVSNDLGNDQDRITLSNAKPFGSYPVAHRLLSRSPGQNQGGAYEVSGLNSAGAPVNQLILRGSFFSTNNVAGAESTVASLFVMSAGATKEALQIRSPGADSDSFAFLLMRIAGVDVLKRIKVGAADSAGTGRRALYVDN